MIRAALLVVAVASASAFAQNAPVGPTNEKARLHQAAGVAAYKAKDFATASKEFAAAYAAERYDGFLFSWAQSDRQRGECASAVELYQRFLATAPPPDFAQLAKDGIAACGGANKPAPVTPAPAPAPATTTVPAPVPAISADDKLEIVDRTPQDPGFRHKLALGLLVAGVGVGTTSAIYYMRARGYRDDANAASAHEDADAISAKIERPLLISRITFGIGLGCIAASAIRFALTDSRNTNGVALGISPSGELFVTGAF